MGFELTTRPLDTNGFFSLRFCVQTPNKPHLFILFYFLIFFRNNGNKPTIFYYLVYRCWLFYVLQEIFLYKKLIIIIIVKVFQRYSYPQIHDFKVPNIQPLQCHNFVKVILLLGVAVERTSSDTNIKMVIYLSRHQKTLQ